MTTTEDLASHRARGRRRQDRRSSRSRKGYQDPHFVEAEAELHPQAAEGRPAHRRRPRARDRLAAAAHPAEPQREDPAGRRRLSRRVAERARSSRSRPGRSRAPWATCTRSGNPHYWLDPENGKRSRRRSRTSCRSCDPADAAYFEQRYADFDKRLDRGREALGRDDGALQGHEGRHLPPLVAELRRALRPRRHRLRRAASRAFRRRRSTRSISSTR